MNAMNMGCNLSTSAAAAADASSSRQAPVVAPAVPPPLVEPSSARLISVGHHPAPEHELQRQQHSQLPRKQQGIDLEAEDGVIAAPAPPPTSSSSNMTHTAATTTTSAMNSSGTVVLDTATSNATSPAQIPLEPVDAPFSKKREGRVQVDNDIDDSNNTNKVDDDEDEVEDVQDDEEDEYEYEDDDDAPFLSGFLVDNPSLAVAAASSTDMQSNDSAPATIRDDEEPATASASTGASSAPASSASAQRSTAAAATTTKWRQPSKEAVNMSLRAEQEKSGGKRRLAQDLYRIMNQDTEEAGFSLEPTNEDSMDKWTIKLFMFDEDSNLAKDMLVLGLEHVELEMSFPDQYPFEPPFVRVVRPRFKRQTGFVMNGALCMELLTKDGWNPINDIESVIVSIRSLLVVGDGRLDVAYGLGDTKYKALLAAARANKEDPESPDPATKRQRRNTDGDHSNSSPRAGKAKVDVDLAEQQRRLARDQGGSYSVSEAESAYAHLSDYHKKKGWDNSGWWAKKG